MGRNCRQLQQRPHRNRGSTIDAGRRSSLLPAKTDATWKFLSALHCNEWRSTTGPDKFKIGALQNAVAWATNRRKLGLDGSKNPIFPKPSQNAPVNCPIAGVHSIPRHQCKTSGKPRQRPLNPSCPSVVRRITTGVVRVPMLPRPQGATSRAHNRPASCR